jgi:catechol 2,3-dioxygenase-like lactoylglutathione lyase family enzyme
MLADAPVYATIPARDFERAKHFYRDTLGLKVEEDRPEGIRLECGGTQLYVYPTFTPAVAGHTLASWEVADLESEMADLRARGVTFEEYDLPGLKTTNGVADMGGERGAWFKDSEGNILAISTRTSS